MASAFFSLTLKDDYTELPLQYEKINTLWQIIRNKKNLTDPLPIRVLSPLQRTRYVVLWILSTILISNIKTSYLNIRQRRESGAWFFFNRSTACQASAIIESYSTSPAPISGDFHILRVLWWDVSTNILMGLYKCPVQRRDMFSLHDIQIRVTTNIVVK